MSTIKMGSSSPSLVSLRRVGLLGPSGVASRNPGEQMASPCWSPLQGINSSKLKPLEESRTIRSDYILLLEYHGFLLFRPIFICTKAQQLGVSAARAYEHDNHELTHTSSTHFLALLRRSSSSRSRWACSRARCWTRFSAAVMRGTMSSNGLSIIRMVLIFGGLREWY